MNHDVLSKSNADGVRGNLHEDDGIEYQSRRHPLINSSTLSNRSADSLNLSRYPSSFYQTAASIPIDSPSLRGSLLSEADQSLTAPEDPRQPRLPSNTNRDDDGDVLYDNRSINPVEDNHESPPTPLPRLQMLIISIVVLSEPLTSSILFPFIYFMLKDFHLSDDEKEIGAYAGWITGMFYVGQFCSAFYWGRASDRYGRRPVLLIGLIGNSLSSCMFGLSKNLWWAVGARALCGFMNGNNGAARSVVSEITDATNRARAFSIFGLCWGVGMIAGPAIGGYLCKPVERFPNIFGGNEFLTKYPYFLPCFVSSLGSLFGFVMGYFYLKESNQAVIARNLQRKYQKYSDADEQTALLINEDHHSIASAERQGIAEEECAKRQEGEVASHGITKASYLVIIFNSVFAFHAMIFDEILPIYFSAPSYASGLDLSSPEVAKALGLAAVQQLIFLFVLYPKLSRCFSTLNLCRIALAIFCITYFLFPELYVAKQWVISHIDDADAQQWTFRVIYLTVLLTRQFGASMAYTSFMILVSNSAHPSVLGTINGICLSCLSLVRALAPTIGGIVWSFSLQAGNVFPFDRHLLYYLIGTISFFNLIQSYYLQSS